MSRWFRIYDDALDDPKVQRLPPELFKAWVNILCLASRGGGKLPDLDDAAFALRVTRDITRDWLDALRERGLIDVDPDDGSLSPHNWNSRQFKSDADPTAAERQRRKRAKSANEPPKIVTRDVTPSRDRTDTDTDTDCEASASLVNAAAIDAPAEAENVVEFDREKSAKRQALAATGEWWNGFAAGLSIPQIDAIKAGSQREKHAWARCREWLDDHDDLAGMFETLEARIRGSPLLRGAKGGWAASFDWVMGASNFQKIMDGNYEDRQAQRRQ